MTRYIGLPMLLVTLVIGGYLYSKDMKSNGPASPTITQMIGQANSSVAATNFEQADAAMQASYAQSGTYAGAALPPGMGVVLVRADATSYCLQTAAGDEHESGPVGSALPGPC